MSTRALNEIHERYLVLPADNIDTDQIIPARFLTTTNRAGLGQHAFADWRGAKDCPLDDPRAADCGVLVAGDNFGCGSSREHAPWALLDLGFQAVVSTSFADIFRQNAHKNGLLTVQVDARVHASLLRTPWQTLHIDVPGCSLTSPDGSHHEFPLDPFAKHCLCNGIDELGYLLEYGAAITAYEEARTS